MIYDHVSTNWERRSRCHRPSGPILSPSGDRSDFCDHRIDGWRVDF
jgi:hypothetical protein